MYCVPAMHVVCNDSLHSVRHPLISDLRSVHLYRSITGNSVQCVRLLMLACAFPKELALTVLIVRLSAVLLPFSPLPRHPKCRAGSFSKGWVVASGGIRGAR